MRLRQGVFNPFIDLLIETVCTVGFYGFMRCGEFTVLKAKQFGPSVKTDPFRKGINIQLHKVQSCVCPYRILTKYLHARKSLYGNFSTDPLFMLNNGQALERQYFINCLKHVLGLCGFT